MSVMNLTLKITENLRRQGNDGMLAKVLFF